MLMKSLLSKETENEKEKSKAKPSKKGGKDTRSDYDLEDSEQKEVYRFL